MNQSAVGFDDVLIVRTVRTVRTSSKSGDRVTRAGTATSGDGYQVLSGELTGHAGKVRGLGDRLAQAVDAARQVTMNNEAFGVLCRPFALLLEPFEQKGVQA